MNKESLILIIGAGSIGERHIRNLWDLGYHNLVVYRQRNLPFRDIGEALVEVELNWENIAIRKPFAAFICTPTSQHLQQVLLCIQSGMHVFVEKPLTQNLENLNALKLLVESSNKLLQVGFMMRFHPLIKRVKTFIEDKTYGNLVSSASHWGSYLPDWHPWENYKESYAANRSLGGGVLLTLCHDIDLAIWMSGEKIKNYSTTASYSAELEINAESIADITINFENGAISNIHLNYLDNPPIRNYHWEFEHSNIDMDYFANILTISSKNNLMNKEEINLGTFDRNQMFLAEVSEFFRQIESIPDIPQYSLNQIKESELIISICDHAG